MWTLLRNTIAAGIVVLVAACNSSSPPTPPAVATESHGHDHAHDHAHPDTGPNGGHLVELGDEEYHIEWTHDDKSGLVTLYVLDGEAKNAVLVAAESLTITAKVNEPIEYKLAAVASSGSPPASAQFELKNPELLVNLQLAGQGADVSVAIAINGKEYRGVFEHHDHGHHH